MSADRRSRSFALLVFAIASAAVLGAAFIVVEIYERRRYAVAAVMMRETAGEFTEVAELSIRGANELRMFGQPGFRDPHWTRLILRVEGGPLDLGGKVLLPLGVRPDQLAAGDSTSRFHGLEITLPRRRVLGLLPPRFELRWVNVSPHPDVLFAFDGLFQAHGFDYVVRQD